MSDPLIATVALAPLIGAIDVEAMRAANYAVDRDDAEKVSPAEAAELLARDIFSDGSN